MKAGKKCKGRQSPAANMKWEGIVVLVVGGEQFILDLPLPVEKGW